MVSVHVDDWKKNLIYKNMWNWPSDLFLILENGWADNSTRCWSPNDLYVRTHTHAHLVSFVSWSNLKLDFEPEWCDSWTTAWFIHADSSGVKWMNYSWSRSQSFLKVSGWPLSDTVYPKQKVHYCRFHTSMPSWRVLDLKHLNHCGKYNCIFQKLQR